MAALVDQHFIALQRALAGEYSLDREIGRGGMGTVYLAREVRLARPVAIKVLPPALASNPTLRSAFVAEAQTAARLNHPHIVPIYAVGEASGFVYMVMAFVEGITLGERIRTRGPLLPGQAARVLREVSWALAYAHGARIVHRDVTAENILLERGSERAIVTDFGIASAMQTAAITHDGLVMGNAHYVSPEQATGEPMDARSDIYSLGVVGYYALTGRLPFDGVTAADVVLQHLTIPAPPIATVAPSVPARLANAVDKCLHKEPLRRYRSAESFAEAIDLAFEHAKEIPAPLRFWLNHGEREGPARLALAGIGAMSGVTLVFATDTAATFLIPFGILLAVSNIPSLARLRAVLREGYVTDDLHAAMREHQLVRAEEMEYERRLSSPLFKRAMRVLFGASLGGLAIGAYLIWEFNKWFGGRRLPWPLMEEGDRLIISVMFLAASGLTLSGVALAGEFVRFHLASRLAAGSIAFWKSRWGSRLAKVASLGMRAANRPVLGMPMLTEIALGRATDHLFDALPKASRKQLAVLPSTVRRLEDDAGKLRQAIDSLDDQISVFDRGDATLNDAEREHMLEELRASRGLGAARLSATVGALENIRLDLLRLQMGSAGIESVTASLDAAERVSQQIVDAVAAQQEVERLLMNTARRDPWLASADDDDADTPVQGVPAAHG